MTASSWVVLALAAGACATACGRGGTPAGPPPTVDQVMEAYVEATGGRAAWERVTAMRGHGRFEIGSSGAAGTFEVVQHPPGDKRTTMRLPGAGARQTGVTGGVVWNLTDTDGARIVTGVDRERELLDLAICRELDWRHQYASGEVVGAVDHRGRPAWKVALVSKVGDRRTAYYDRETHLLLGAEVVAETGSGTLRRTTRVLAYGDYPPVEMERVVEIATGDVTVRMTLESVEINPELPADAFALPAEVAALRGRP